SRNPVTHVLQGRTADYAIANPPYPFLSPQRRHHDQPDNPDHQAVLQRVVDLAVPVLHLAARQMNFVELAEHLVESADMLAVDVLGGGSFHDVVADPAVDRGHEAELHRTFDVAEQDDAVDVGGVLGAVNKSLVEHERLAVAPDAFDAVDQDPALVRIRR